MLKHFGLTLTAFFLMPMANAEVQRIPLVTADDVTLHASYYPAKSAGPALLMFNMCNPAVDQFAWEPLAKRMSERGFHVMTFDYRGFGESEGELPTGLRSIAEAMPYWKENWMPDVLLAYETLLSKPLVDSSHVAVAGASCGVFLGLELALLKDAVKTLVFLGGPTSNDQRERLRLIEDLPILIMTGNQRGPNETEGTLEWSDNLFNASRDTRTRLVKYRSPVYATMMLKEHPETLTLAEDWLSEMISSSSR